METYFFNATVNLRRMFIVFFFLWLSFKYLSLCALVMVLLFLFLTCTYGYMELLHLVWESQ